MGIKHARSSTRHRISRQRSRFVVETTSVIFAENAPDRSALGATDWCSLALTRELLEVMAIQTDDGGLLVIHAQPIRARYLKLLTGGLR